MTGTRTGTVVRVDHNGRTVALDPNPTAADGEPPPGGALVRCETRGALHRTLKRDRRGRVVVGDRVQVMLAEDGTGVIEDLLERRSILARRAAGEGHREQITAANIDRIACVVAARAPEWRPGFVDRVLCAAERAALPATIILNKIDLLDEQERAALAAALAPYAAIDVPVLWTSVARGEGMDALRAHLAGRVTVVAGPSGVGKSSLLNALQPGLGLATQTVSASTRKGRHTTTAVSMMPLEGGGFVVDTPGVRSFGFYDIEARELGWLFKDLRPFAYTGGDPDAPQCRFQDCRHRGEPGCEVRRAVREGRLSAARYDSYVRILESIEAEASG